MCVGHATCHLLEKEIKLTNVKITKACDKKLYFQLIERGKIQNDMKRLSEIQLHKKFPDIHFSQKLQNIIKNL